MKANLEFGVLCPSSYENGIARLPDETHPRLRRDVSMRHLHSLYQRLLPFLENYDTDTLRPLEDRMVPLTQEDVDLLEKWSFRRSKEPILENEYTFLMNFDNPWTLIYGSDDDTYYHWTIWLMNPRYPTEEFMFPCIKTFEHATEDKEAEYNIGLVTPRELDQLIGDVQSHNSGAIHSIITNREMKAMLSPMG